MKSSGKAFEWLVRLGQPEGVVGGEGKHDGEGDESVQPGNVGREERRRHLQKSH